MNKKSSIANKYCNAEDLTNEASVESFFVLRLLKNLGYEDKDIKTKQSIDSLSIPRGRRREQFKPDFILTAAGKPRWVLDAKSTTEDIEEYTYQCAGYSLLINQKLKDRPVRYYVLTSGFLTRVYEWDHEEAILSLHFQDFVDGNANFKRFCELLHVEIASKGWEQGKSSKFTGHKLERPQIEEIKKAFTRCHRIIWKAEKMSPQAAFFEFAKLLFVKIMEDKQIRNREDLHDLVIKKQPLPPAEVRFSTTWIEEQERKFNVENPVNKILFHQLKGILEKQISDNGKKRIFEKDEELRLSSGTAKRVVGVLESYFLFGIDEDLNGRMFETFLSATMRGQDLGQYFSPRSITKLLTRIANFKVSEDHTDKIIDACCGTGGFLIEALTVMRKMIDENRMLTRERKESLKDEIANECIYGIDASRDPALARIARINMYLHGDGGSRIYMTDALRKIPGSTDADSNEIKNEIKELRDKLSGSPSFDVAITNPPFSMSYSTNDPDENEILKQYEIAVWDGKRKASLRSAVMFMERYWNLLKPSGRLFTVIDDSVLSSKSFAFARDWIREHFIVRGIVSLHGDAFQRQGARAKTSILCLEKTEKPSEQPAFFVYESQYIGVDDVVTRTPRSVAEQARENAKKEIETISQAYQDFLIGKRGSWLLAGDVIVDRMDVKFLQPWTASTLRNDWVAAGAESDILGSIVDVVRDEAIIDPEKTYSFLRVTYSGRAERGESRRGDELSYSKMSIAKEGDLVISNIGAVYGSICVLPKEYEDCLISSEFTVLRMKKDAQADAMYTWSVLRSPAILAEWISDSSGVSRHRIEWEKLKDQVIPMLPAKKQKEIGNMYREMIRKEQEAGKLMRVANEQLSSLHLDAEGAVDRLKKAKPPR